MGWKWEGTSWLSSLRMLGLRGFSTYTIPKMKQRSSSPTSNTLSTYFTPTTWASFFPKTEWHVNNFIPRKVEPAVRYSFVFFIFSLSILHPLPPFPWSQDFNLRPSLLPIVLSKSWIELSTVQQYSSKTISFTSKLLNHQASKQVVAAHTAISNKILPGHLSDAFLTRTGLSDLSLVA